MWQQEIIEAMVKAIFFSLTNPNRDDIYARYMVEAFEKVKEATEIQCGDHDRIIEYLQTNNEQLSESWVLPFETTLFCFSLPAPSAIKDNKKNDYAILAKCYSADNIIIDNNSSPYSGDFVQIILFTKTRDSYFKFSLEGATAFFFPSRHTFLVVPKLTLLPGQEKYMGEYSDKFAWVANKLLPIFSLFKKDSVSMTLMEPTEEANIDYIKKGVEPLHPFYTISLPENEDCIS